MASPFRFCDIRGLYPEEVTEELFHDIGRRLASRCSAGEPILIARDHRLSSESLRKALVDGLLSGGVTVLDAGAVPTPVLYFGKRMLGVRYALSVTASHNPADSNGLKILPPNHEEIAEEVASLAGEQGHLLSRSGGSLESVDLLAPYAGWLEDRWRSEVSHAAGERLVLDPGNGLWSGIAAPIFERLGLHASAIHDTPCGSFPNRSPDCTAPHELDRLGEEVRRREAAAGFAWDGDGDRLVICDDTGRALSTDQVALLTIPKLLRRHPGEPVLTDVKMSRRVREAIEAHGGRPLMERSAHCLLERAMRQNRCLCGYEYSGHFFFRELEFADDGMFAALECCALLLQPERKLSESVAALPCLFITPDIRIAGGQAEFAEIGARLSAEFRNERFSRLDGLRIEMADGWLLVRQSISENRITWRLEADTKPALSALLRRAGRVLPEYRDILARYE